MELNKTMEDMKSEHAFAMHRKTAELLDDLKQVGRAIGRSFHANLTGFPFLSSLVVFFFLRM